MKAKLLTLMPVLLGLALLGACTDGTPVAAPDAGPDPLVEKLVKMGFPRDQIVDGGEYYLVEGDMRIDKKDLRAAAPGRRGPSGQRLAGLINQTTVVVNLSGLDTEWADAARAAMASLTATVGNSLVMVEGSPANINVVFAGLDLCEAGRAMLPSNGAPGHTLWISTDYQYSYTPAQKTWIVAHELGHTIGLHHTDNTSAPLIPGTPSSDAGSVMNSGAVYPGCPPNAPQWSGLSFYDQAALWHMYPLPQVTGLNASNVGGNVYLGWNPVAGASHYEYQKYEITHHTSGSYGGGYGWNSVFTSSVDTGSWYTGISECNNTPGDDYFQTFFNWQVQAVFPNGKRSRWSSVPSRDAYC